MEKIKVGGMMLSEGKTVIKLNAETGDTNPTGRILSLFGENEINSELIALTMDEDGGLQLAIVIAENDIKFALAIIEENKDRISIGNVSHINNVAVISIFGPHLREKPKAPGTMVSALMNGGIEIFAISTSISTISCVVRESVIKSAADALLEVFHAPFQVSKRPQTY